MVDPNKPVEPGKKRITVRELIWFYAVGVKFEGNGVILRPEDEYRRDADGEHIVIARERKVMDVPPGYLWREEREFEIDVKDEQADGQ